MAFRDKDGRVIEVYDEAGNRMTAPPAGQPGGSGLATVDLNQSTAEMMTSMATSFALSNALRIVRPFDGKNMPLKNFLQDVKNGAATIPTEQQSKYVAAVIAQLSGAARDSLWGKTIATVDELVSQLKQRFAPGRTYSYFTNKISALRMRQGESVGDFFDHLNMLVTGAKNCLKEMMPPIPTGATEEQIRAHEREREERALLPLQPLAMDTFIKGLPVDIARSVDACGARTLEEAYKEAVRIEARMEAQVLPDTRFKARPELTPWERAQYAAERTRGTERYPNRYPSYVGAIQASKDPEWICDEWGQTPNVFEENKSAPNPWYQPSEWSWGEDEYPAEALEHPQTPVYVGQIYRSGDPRQGPPSPWGSRNPGRGLGPRMPYGPPSQPNPRMAFRNDPRLFNPYEQRDVPREYGYWNSYHQQGRSNIVPPRASLPPPENARGRAGCNEWLPGCTGGPYGPPGNQWQQSHYGFPPAGYGPQYGIPTMPESKWAGETSEWEKAPRALNYPMARPAPQAASQERSAPTPPTETLKSSNSSSPYASGGKRA